MARFSEYHKYTIELEEQVNKISKLLYKRSDNLDELTAQLEILFKLFSRGDELVTLIQSYSKDLRNEIDSIRKTYVHYKNATEGSYRSLVRVGELLKSINHLLQNIQTSAGLFITSAQSLVNVAKNAEICAHHAQEEGKGLAIIARECLSLAQRAQLPFRGLSILLRNLQRVANPATSELHTIIKLSSRSQSLLEKSLESLVMIDEIAISLENIISRVAEHSEINSRLKKNIAHGIGVLKDQVVSSSRTLDDISIRCAQFTSLERILETLDNTLSRFNKHGTKRSEPAVNHHASQIEKSVERQLNFSLNENIEAFKQLPKMHELRIFAGLTTEDLTTITRQIDILNLSGDELMDYEKDLGTACADIVKSTTQIEEFLDEAQNIWNHLHSVTKDLTDKLKDIETLITTTSKICTKIKTLTVFARIEERISAAYQSLLSPIVEEFVRVQAKTEDTLLRITPQIAELQRDVEQLKKEKIAQISEKIKHPDYAKIKIFLDDIVRIFREEKEQVKAINEVADELYGNDRLLKEIWNDYKRSLMRISKISTLFNNILEKQKTESPGIIKSKSIVTMSLPDDPLTLKPDKKTDVHSHQVICNFSVGLFQFGEGTGVIPGLAEDYSLSADGTEYTFKMRTGLKFQNGKVLEIENIREALVRALEGPNFNFFEMIRGAKRFVETRDRALLGIEIVNSSQIKIKLEYPFLPIISNLSTNSADPYLPGELPICMGPFKITDWEQGKRIILTANDHYFEGRPPIDELHFRIIKEEEESYELFRNGTLSIYLPTGENLKRIRNEMPTSLCTAPELSVGYLCIHCQKEPFDSKQVRQAIAYAIDTKGLVDTILKESAITAEGIFPPSLLTSRRRSVRYTYNPRKAKDILHGAGFKNGLPVIYPLDVTESPSVLRQAELIKSNLADIGIRVEINSMPWHNLVEKTFAGESILSLRGWVSDNGDPDNFMYPLFHSASRGRTGNTFFFSLPEIDKAIEHARTMRNVHQRNLLYLKIEEQILDESPGVFLFHRLQNIAIQRNISGIKPHPLGLLRAKYVCPAGTKSFHLHTTRDNALRSGVTHAVYSPP